MTEYLRALVITGSGEWLNSLEAVEGEEGWVESSGIRRLEGPWGWMSKMHRMEVGEQ